MSLDLLLSRKHSLFTTYISGRHDVSKNIGDFCFKISFVHYSIFSETKDVITGETKSRSWVVWLPATLATLLLYKLTIPIVLVGMYARYSSASTTINQRAFEKTIRAKSSRRNSIETKTAPQSYLARTVPKPLVGKVLLLHNLCSSIQRSEDLDGRFKDELKKTDAQTNFQACLALDESPLLGTTETMLDFRSTYPNIPVFCSAFSGEQFTEVTRLFIQASPLLLPYGSRDAIIYPAQALRSFFCHASQPQVENFLSSELDDSQKQQVILSTLNALMVLDEQLKDKALTNNLHLMLKWLLQNKVHFELPVKPSTALETKLSSDTEIKAEWSQVQAMASPPFDEQLLHSVIVDLLLRSGKEETEIHPQQIAPLAKFFEALLAQVDDLQLESIQKVAEIAANRTPIALLKHVNKGFDNMSLTLQELPKEISDQDEQANNECVVALIIYALVLTDKLDLIPQMQTSHDLFVFVMQTLVFAPQKNPTMERKKHFGFVRKSYPAAIEEKWKNAFEEIMKQWSERLDPTFQAKIIRAQWMMQSLLKLVEGNKQPTQSLANAFSALEHMDANGSWLVTSNQYQNQWIWQKIQSSSIARSFLHALSSEQKKTI